MPPRRTSPRRSATRPSAPFGQFGPDDDYDEPGRLAAAAPWIALAAFVVAGAALALTLLGRGGGAPNLDACRKTAWAAVPSSNDLPEGWTLSATDLNANGMTVSVLGTPSTDGSTSTPVVYASVTCYGDVAATAMSQYRDAAKAAGATVTDRGLGGDAYDVDNPSSGSVTTLFRVGGLIGQIADAGSASPSELATITSAVAAAMGDRSAAGTSGDQANASDIPASGEPSLEPGSSDEVASEPPTAPELEAHMPTDAGGTSLTVVSGIATDFLPQDPSGGALIAALRQDGIGAADLEVAQAYDESQAADLNVIGFRLRKGDVAKLRTAVIDSWLSGSAPGVKQTSVKLGTKTFTKIDYGTDRFDWVYTGTDYVIVIETSDATLATEVAGSVK